MEEQTKFGKFHDRYYKLILLIPVVLLVVSFFYISQVYFKTGDIMFKDTSLSGGTIITLKGEFDIQNIEQKLNEKFSGLSYTELTDLQTKKPLAIIIQSSLSVEELKPEIEKILGYSLTDDNSSIEFTGSALGQNFYKQLLFALLISFILMSIVIFFLFRTFIPSIAVIFAAFSDIVMPLAILDFFQMKISAAGIAAFLMLIGYSVDTDILLTTRALKNSEGTLNSRLYRAFKVGTLMTITALAAVIPAFFLISSLPDSFRQIFLILALGLSADLINTWLTNLSIIKWYCEKKNIK